MCLYTGRKPTKWERGRRTGYKVFRLYAGFLHSVMHCEKNKLPVGEWLTAIDREVGFGVFLSRRKAAKWGRHYGGYPCYGEKIVVRKVRIEGVESGGTGFQYGHGVIARRIFILRNGSLKVPREHN